MRASRIVIMTGCLTLIPAIAHAQEGPATLEFSFSNPGARSMGLGGAFLALADDATAAFANPAGLVQLIHPEISLEGRSRGFDTSYTERGRASGTPTGFGIDNIPGLRFGESSNNLQDLSFLSFVYPVKNWSLAVYRHQLANFESTTRTQGLFQAVFPEGTNRFEDTRTLTDLDFVTYGLSAGYKISEVLSVGFGVSYFDGAMDLTWSQYWIDEDTIDSFFAPNSFLPERLIETVDMSTRNSDWGVSAGFHWMASERLSVGGVFRQGPEFKAEIVGIAGPLFEDGVPAGATFAIGSTPIVFPDVYGIGIAVRSRDQSLTASFDWDRVNYSTIMNSLDRNIFDSVPRIDDGDELHAGLEYVFLEKKPLMALRFGVWVDPDHRVQPSDASTDAFERAVLRPGSDELHFAAGFGLVLPAFKLDAALDLSEPLDTVSLSAIYRF